MSQPGKSVSRIVWGALVLAIAGIIIVAAVLKIANPGPPPPVIGQVSAFALTNQLGEAVTLDSLKGKVWVADIIFTRCPGPCTAMSRRFSQLQAALPAGQPVRLVSFTSDPEYDTPKILNRYADRFNADASRWWFLTGENKLIRHLAVGDFKFVVVEKQPGDREIPDDLFLHSTWFVLVDAQGRIRGWNDAQGRLHAYYASEDPESSRRLLADIDRLLRETNP